MDECGNECGDEMGRSVAKVSAASLSHAGHAQETRLMQAFPWVLYALS